MILINLLPHREEKRQLRKQAFFAGLGAAVVIGAVVVGLWYAFQQQMISAQQARNEFLSEANRKLDVEIKDVSSLKAEIEALKARQSAVEDLQTDRNMPVYLLNELVKQTPEGIYLTSVKQEGQSVLVAGTAQSNERVSEFLRNTGSHSEWLVQPQLQEIKAAVRAGKDPRDAKRLYDFSVRISLKRPADVSAAASGASAAQSAASAALPS
ncbi:MAG: PilN domain-containing protein [Aquabacterium sp.]|nr:PilN domain-containing protein [Aquabacterium sp.]MBP8190312.1 PilN domain-containing protein [Aquabacterium sp.]MDQ5926876.1 Fimbrial assembly protein [Pseudomonadota bacterium]